jgi:hypothetical protein
MSDEQDGFLFPGIFDVIPDGSPIAFHEAGLDRLSVMYDPQDIFPQDPYLETETPEMRAREKMPQWGPNYVAAVHEQISAVDQKLDQLRTAALRRWSYEPTTEVFIGSMQTSAAGVIDTPSSDKAMLFEPPPGFTLALHRFTIKVFDPSNTQAGSNFGNPFNVAAGYWELRVNGDFVDGGSLVANAGSFPAVKTWGTRDAIRIRDGEVLSLFVNGTATLANKTLSIRGQGTYDRTIEG